MATHAGHLNASDLALLMFSVGLEEKGYGRGFFMEQLGAQAADPHDIVPPTIENMTPSPEVAPGELGGFPLNYAAARLTPIAFDVLDVNPGLRLLVVTVRLATDVLVAYDGAGDGFQPGWTVLSTIAPIADGWHLELLPDLGWPMGAEVTVTVRAVDAHGNLRGEPEPEPEDVLSSIVVTPGAPTFAPTAGADRLQLTATALYSVSGPADVTALVTWSSGSPAVATVNATGQVAAVSAYNGSSGAAPTALMAATLGAVSGYTTVAIDTARDATRGIRRPANAYQWGLLNSAPTHLYLCQEASGNLADSIGALALTANAAPLYQQTIAAASWDAKKVAFTNATNQRFAVEAGSGPNPAATSVAWLVHLHDLASSGATRNVFVMAGPPAGSSIYCDNVSGTNTLRIRTSVGGSATTVNAHSAADVALLFIWNRTAGTYRLLSSIEQLSGFYDAAAADGRKGVGAALNSSSTSATFGVSLLATWEGAAAEALDKTLLSRLGWTVPY